MIYQLYMLKNQSGANTALAKITPEERNALMQSMSAEALNQYGAQTVLDCACAWANEEYSHWGITSFKSIQGRIAQVQASEKLGLYRVAEFFSLLGTLDGDEPKLPDYPNPIYQLWLMRNNPVLTANFMRSSKEELAEIMAKHAESEKRTETYTVLYCKSAWANEEYVEFGVSAFPNIEACQAHRDDLENFNWPLYSQSTSILGIVEPRAS